MSNYDEVFELAQQLTTDEQLRLIEELAKFIRYQLPLHRKHSVLEFEGLGKETWAGIDVEKYIDEERNSWE